MKNAASTKATRHSPTTEQFAAYSAMYDYFNAELFGGVLLPVLLNFSRMTNTYGFFAPNRWGRKDGTGTHEISLNPSHLGNRAAHEVAATLVHEMCHAWQQQHGTPGRGRYHNEEWAAKMESVGLMPSNTGEAGGARVGDRMTHYIIERGKFTAAYDKMRPEIMLPWTSFDSTAAKKKRPPSKIKYSCMTCEANAWGKPALHIMCGDCEETMVPAESTD